MRKIFTFVLLFVFANCFSQPVYTSANYATIGDTFYITLAQPAIYDFNTTGPNFSWDYSGLTGISQQQLLFRDPKKTGFSQLQWPYIYNTNNVNLSSTNNQTIAIGSLEETNPNDYFLKSNTSLTQKASSYAIAFSGIDINAKNVYTSADTLYKFPLNYQDTFASNASYITSIPGLYYITQTINRTNTADGWGTLITPYGNYTNCIRIKSYVVQTDSFSIAGVGLPSITTNYTELKWLDTSTDYPVLFVKQVKTGNTYVIASIQYVDKKETYKPVALFAYAPLLPLVNDTVSFQNLSINSTAYLWDFGDGATSTEINPQHVFKTAGTYAIRLIAYNDSLSDTIQINVLVNSVLALNLISFTGNHNSTYNQLNWSAAGSEESITYNLQRSDNSVDYSTINSIVGLKTSSAQNYSYGDESFNATNNYYRLQMIDANGNIRYSNVLMLAAGIQSTLNITPNPLHDGNDIVAKIASSSTGNAIVYIVNSDGKLMYNMPVNIVAGDNIFKLSTRNFARGVYFILVKGALNLNAKVLVE